MPTSLFSCSSRLHILGIGSTCGSLLAVKVVFFFQAWFKVHRFLKIIPCQKRRKQILRYAYDKCERGPYRHLIRRFWQGIYPIFTGIPEIGIKLIKWGLQIFFFRTWLSSVVCKKYGIPIEFLVPIKHIKTYPFPSWDTLIKGVSSFWLCYEIKSSVLVSGALVSEEKQLIVSLFVLKC